MKTNYRISAEFFALVLMVLVGAVLVGPLQAREPGKTRDRKGGDDGPERILELEGTNVHNVGELQMHLFNWGEWGSRPGTAERYSFAPSAQWPAGSGVEYLFTAGLWVGAIKSGIPSVSTATYERELRPTQDPRDKLYSAEEGALGGNRQPSAHADDDGDGRIDEDPLDGYDNDNDGQIDEDYAAISRLMFRCRYSDKEQISTQIYPEHNPLNISISQESYQWASGRLDDFIGINFLITNTGEDVLQDIYIGMYIDGDVGPLDKENYWEDDMTGRASIPTFCTDLGPTQADVAYMFDADGDDGRTPGYFGITFLDHTTDTSGVSAPGNFSIATYAHFSGRQTFAFGGDPTNDFERYEILSEHSSESPSTLARDYRMLLSIGPFGVLFPDSTISVQAAFVMGAGTEELLNNAASAWLAYNGSWFNLDGDPMTGIEGRENPVAGPHEGKVWEDECRHPKQSAIDFEGCDTERLDDRFILQVRHIAEGDTLWTNQDCWDECDWKALCGYTEADSLQFRTGVAGRESQVHWIVRAAPPPPRMRVDDHAKDGVVVYWDNFSEIVPAILLEDEVSNFEGYQVWRADDWTRPIGTSKTTGPPTKLWSALIQADHINNWGEDTGLDRFRYEPLEHELTRQQKTDFLATLRNQYIEFPDQEPICPPGVTNAVCDTLKAMALAQLGRRGGKIYYHYVDRSIQLGAPYFYSVVAFDHGVTAGGKFETGFSGDPASNFVYVEPKSAAQPLWRYESKQIYVVPNPVTKAAMADWTLEPTNDDPTGIKLEFRNLPKAVGTIRIFTIAGDLVMEIPFDARGGNGTVPWDLVSRNGQDVTSGVYLFTVHFEDSSLERVVDKFTIIR